PIQSVSSNTPISQPLHRQAHYSFTLCNDTPTAEIYTLSLHDALPICDDQERGGCGDDNEQGGEGNDTISDDQGSDVEDGGAGDEDRKSTRLNSSHGSISYAVFCLKKKKSGRDGGGQESSV